MTHRFLRSQSQHLCLLLALLANGGQAMATPDTTPDINYQAELSINAGSGDFAPYYIASGRGGTITQQGSALLNASLWHPIDSTKQFSYGFGAEMWSGYATSTSYAQYSAEAQKWTSHSLHPARLWLQQLYGEVKYRCLTLTAGMKQAHSPLLNSNLSSGDLVMSGNARPMAGVTIGSINYQPIPFTRGWVNIDAQLGYYKPGDNNWMSDHYNYFSHSLTTGYTFNYKRLHFRTKPNQPWVFTIGAQAACQFGGTRVLYNDGKVEKTIKMKTNFKSLIHTIIPGGGSTDGDQQYVEGNHLGSWDMMLSHQLPHGNTIKAYYQSLWEDGSGIGKLNGFDGLWGIEYCANKPSIVSGALLEYLDFTNQSGPIHWAPGDHDNPQATGMNTPSTGADNYYNNYAYNGYHHHGMAIGSPFVKSPIYNTDGYIGFTDNRMRGFHMALMGYVTPTISYRTMLSYRKSWGTPFIPHITPTTSTSFMLEGNYAPEWMPQLKFKAQFALDHGTLLGNNCGALLSISYHGNFTLKK